MAIFIIDDEKEYLSNLKEALSLYDIDDVYTYSNWEDAYNKMLNVEPTLIFLDLILPNIYGIDALKIILKQFPQTQVIILTCENSKETAKQCIKNGASDYLVKPIRLDQLVKFCNVPSL